LTTTVADGIAATFAYAWGLSGSAASPQPFAGSSSNPPASLPPGSRNAYDALPRSTSTTGSPRAHGPLAPSAVILTVVAASRVNGCSAAFATVIAAMRTGTAMAAD